MRPVLRTRWSLTPREAMRLQERLRDRAVLEDRFDAVRTVAGYGSETRLARVGYAASDSLVGTPASGLPPSPSLATVKDCTTLSFSGSR